MHDLLIDDQEHKVRFLLVEHGGFIGLGETKSFIPVDGRSYHGSIYGYYGYTPYWGASYSYPGFLGRVSM